MPTFLSMTSPPIPERHSPHTVGNRAARVLWGFVYLFLFRPSPRNFHRWRNWLLRLFGANLHPTARVYPRARIWLPSRLIMHEYATISDDVDCYCVERVEIGKSSTVSQYTYLCGASHDFEDPTFPLQPGPIRIGEHCWIAADVFIAPGIEIGDGSVVAARSAVFRDLKGWTVYAGSPARAVRPRRLTPQDFEVAPGADAELDTP